MTSFIRSLDNGRYRAEVRHKTTFIANKVFPTQAKAKAWSASVESQIRQILELPAETIKTLNPEEISQLGGIELFKKLGVAVPEIITIRQLADEFMGQWRGKDFNMPMYIGFWIQYLGDVPIKSVSPADIRNILKQHRPGRNKNTWLRYKCALSTLFRFAAEELYIDPTFNPARALTIKSEPNEIIRYLDANERKRLLDACRTVRWDKLYLLVLMAMTTGMRKSELLGLRWSDIDFDRQLAMLETSKNGEPRHNPIPDGTMTELKKFREIGNGLIFASLTNPAKPYYFRFLWDQALERANIKAFRFHDLRHDFCSQLAMNGAATHDIKELAGHRCLQTTQRYIHLSTEHKAAVANRIMSKVMGVKP